MLAKQTNYTNLRQNLASILDEAIADRRVIVVTRRRESGDRFSKSKRQFNISTQM